MKSTFGLLALAAAAKLVSAHATVYAVWINDVDQGLGNTADGYIRSPPNNSPLTDVTSADMTCNVNGKKAVAKTLSVKAGDKVTFEWHHDSRSASDDIIASSHHGPVMVYMAPTEKGTAGNGWVKIAEEGYSNGKWAVDNLIANKGKHSITVPDVPAGEYLLRPEIIALHEGNRQGGAQFYMECVQVKVTSAGTKTLPAGVSIPGAYKATDPGVLFDIYNSFTSYPIPGPAVWDGSSSGSSGSSSGSSGSSGSSAAATTAPAAAVTAAPTKQQGATSVAPTTLVTAAKPTTTAAPPASSGSNTGSSSGSGSSSSSGSNTGSSSGSSSSSCSSSNTGSSSSGNAIASGKLYAQCGGQNYSGATSCEAGLVCHQWNPYYHQCVKA